jgi:hypothetical protein
MKRRQTLSRDNGVPFSEGNTQASGPLSLAHVFQAAISSRTLFDSAGNRAAYRDASAVRPHTRGRSGYASRLALRNTVFVALLG